mgnify:CR=1 FL=1
MVFRTGYFDVFIIGRVFTVKLFFQVRRLVECLFDGVQRALLVEAFRRGEQAADVAVPDDGQFLAALLVGLQIQHLDQQRTGRMTVIYAVGIVPSQPVAPVSGRPVVGVIPPPVGIVVAYEVGHFADVAELDAHAGGVFVLGARVARIVEFAEQFQRGMTGIERFAEIMDTPVAIKDAPDAVPLQPGPGEIRFEKVCFEYPDDHNKVLHDVSLDIRAGERLALVGASGGGKTTLCNLIPRFYEVTSGRILIDGQDIRRVTLKSLRQDIGIVQQDVYLFSGTVAQNIAYGKPGATRQEIEAAARLAGAEKFILALKDGYDTYVGERGVKLSGGQKQRIAIARVFLKNPPILILDEATSALDNESEILVGQSLEKLAHGRTTLTIAHRLTTIKDYDRILVLGEEGIVEEGTHAQLLEKQGIYYRLWNQLPGEDTL